MKHILFILLLLPTLIGAQVLKEYELCSVFIQKEIKANTSANATVWSINPFMPFQVDTDVMYITFDNIGTYVITAKFSNGLCYIEDKLIIKIIECKEAFLYIPSAFTPNGDGYNDEFGAYGINIKDFNMQIFNRWGELLFTSIKITDRWSGIYNLTYCQNDIYVYKIIYKDNNNKYYNKIGKITLLK